MARMLQNTQGVIAICSGVSSFAMPPNDGQVAWVEDAYNPKNQRAADGLISAAYLYRPVIPELELEIWGDVAATVTVAQLFEGRLKLLDFSPKTIASVDTGADTIEVTGHALQNGDKVFFATTDTLPLFLSTDTPYYVNVVDVNNFSVHPNREEALKSGGTKVPIDSAGTGTHTVVDINAASETADRIHWLLVDDLGVDGDGAITVSASQGYKKRISHHPRTVAYAINATTTAAISADLCTVLEDTPPHR